MCEIQMSQISYFRSIFQQVFLTFCFYEKPVGTSISNLFYLLRAGVTKILVLIIALLQLTCHRGV